MKLIKVSFLLFLLLTIVLNFRYKENSQNIDLNYKILDTIKLNLFYWVISPKNSCTNVFNWSPAFLSNNLKDIKKNGICRSYNGLLVWNLGGLSFFDYKFRPRLDSIEKKSVMVKEFQYKNHKFKMYQLEMDYIRVIMKYDSFIKIVDHKSIKNPIWDCMKKYNSPSTYLTFYIPKFK